jgi:nucleoside-diphosphate-sugar epimerase
MKALVTGATGFVGEVLARTLLKSGATVRILARNPDKAAPLRAAGADVVVGESGAMNDLSQLCHGIDTVFHLASVMRGSSSEFERVDIQGTRRLLAAAESAGVRRLVYVSTLAAYPPLATGTVIDENTPLDRSGKLGNYALAKARCEQIVLAATTKPERVVVRLGLVCGPGAAVLPPHVCKPISSERVILFGSGAVKLPLTLVDNAVDALVCAASADQVAGQIFHIVDDESLTQAQYLQLLRDSGGGLPGVLKLPIVAYYALGTASELVARLRHKEPETTAYRIRSRMSQVSWDCSKAKRILHWQPRAPLRAGLREAFRKHAENVPKS